MPYTVRMVVFAYAFLMLIPLTRAGDPPPSVQECAGFQRCGDHCLPWSAVCRDTLADSVGLTAPEVLPIGATAPPANVPLGSTLLSLPGTHEAGRPIMRPGGPAFCYDGKTTDDLSIQMACIPYYSVGVGASAVRPARPLAECPQHRRCGGECVGETEVCMVENPERDTDRLTPFEP